MSQPGWYPDPAGSGGLRYWDGRQWTGEVQAPAASSPRWSKLQVALIGALVFAVIVALGWLLTRGGSAPVETASPTASSWNEQPEGSSSPPTPSGTSGSQIPCPSVEPSSHPTAASGQVTGGGLSFKLPTGWGDRAGQVSALLTDTATAQKPYPDTSWLSFMEIGYAPGLTNAETAGLQVIQCHLTSIRFPGLDRTQDLDSTAVEVDGVSGWQTTVHAGSAEAPGGGASFTAVVLDSKDGTPLRVFLAGALDADLQAALDVADTASTLGVT